MSRGNTGFELRRALRAAARAVETSICSGVGKLSLHECVGGTLCDDPEPILDEAEGDVDLPPSESVGCLLKYVAIFHTREPSGCIQTQPGYSYTFSGAEVVAERFLPTPASPEGRPPLLRRLPACR